MSIKDIGHHDARNRRWVGRYVTSPTVFRITAQGNTMTSNLAVGMYRVTSELPCYFLQCNGAGTNAASTNAHFMPANTETFLRVASQHRNIAVTAVAGAGSVYIGAIDK